MSEGGCYRNKSARDMAAISVFRVAHKLFSEASLIQHIDDLQTIYNTNPVNFNKSHQIFKKLDPPFLDAFRLATSFENLFKAELILYGYIVHKIINNNKYSSIYKQQKSRPIKVSEIKSIENDPWPNNGSFKINCLSKNTLSLADLISKNSRYRNSLRLSSYFINSIDIIRKHRNTIHFVVNDMGRFNVNVVDSYIYLRSFFNKRIINKYNSVINRWDHLKNNPEIKLYEI